MPRPTVALCWYSRSRYSDILSIMADKERLPPSFDEWRNDAMRLEGQVEGRYDVRRVPLNPDEFLEWCREASVSPDAFARDRYANERASRSSTAIAVSSRVPTRAH
jgi:hypothetical protein